VIKIPYQLSIHTQITLKSSHYQPEANHDSLTDNPPALQAGEAQFNALFSNKKIHFF